MDITRTLIVCSSPRTGSTMLCRDLTALGVCGRPEEYFEEWRLPGVFVKNWGAAGFEEYLPRFYEAAATPNGVAATGMHWRHFEKFLDAARTLDAFRGRSAADIVACVFPGARFVFISRRDKVRQAVSECFDAASIYREIAKILHYEKCWRGYFAAHSIRPLEIVYEDMIAAYPETLRRVLDFVGVPRPEHSFPKPLLERRSDDLNDRRVERYRRANPLSVRMSHAASLCGESLKAALLWPLKAAAAVVQNTVARSCFLTKLYVRALACVIRPVKSECVKQAALKGLHAARWPETELGALDVTLGKSRIRLVPRFFEPEIEAVVTDRPKFKAELFAFLESAAPEYRTIIHFTGGDAVLPVFLSVVLARAGADRALHVLTAFGDTICALRRNLELNGARNAVVYHAAPPAVSGPGRCSARRRHAVRRTFFEEAAGVVLKDGVSGNPGAADAAFLKGLAAGKSGILLILDPEAADYSDAAPLVVPLAAEIGADILIESLPVFEEALKGFAPLLAAGFPVFNITDSGLVRREGFSRYNRHRFFLLRSPR